MMNKVSEQQFMYLRQMKQLNTGLVFCMFGVKARINQTQIPLDTAQMLVNNGLVKQEKEGSRKYVVSDKGTKLLEE